MSDSDKEENGKPIPKNSQTMEEENNPKESINNNEYQNEEENNKNNDNLKNMNNEEIQNNEEDNNFPEHNNEKNENNENMDNNFPNPANDDFDNYMSSNLNNEKKDEEFVDDFNNDNTFKEEEKNNNDNNNDDNNENNNGNNNTFRISNISNIENANNNRYSNNNDINNENENKKNENENQENENENQENENENENQENENENKFEFNEDNNNNNNINDNNGAENINENNDDNNQNQNFRNSDSFGFRESDLKENNNNMNNPYENENNNDIRNSGNSDHKQINEENNNIINNNKQNNEENNNNLRNRPNNIYNPNNNLNNNNYNYNNNNNFNYARNPYSSPPPPNNNNNNYYQNGGGFDYSPNLNRTAAQFIPQDSHFNNLNYNYSSNNSDNITYHNDYDRQYEQYEEFPEDTDGFHIDPKKRGKDSAISAGIQIANTIMGAGILSIPIIMSYMGFIVGIIIVIFLAVSTLYSVYILIRCHEITGKNGYSMFGKITMGKIGSILVKIIIIINNFGICVCYFRIFGEVMQTILQTFISPNSYWMTNWHNYIYILFGSVIMFAFIFIKNISSLKKVSYLGVISVLIFAVCLSLLLFYYSATDKLDSYISWDYFIPNCTFEEAFHSIPTVFIAFLFQFNVFPIYYSLKHRDFPTMKKASIIGIGYSLVMFLIVGIIGFLIYGAGIDDTLLDNLSDDMIKYRSNNAFIVLLIILICISFVITCLTSFPILFLSLRVNYVNALTVCIKSFKNNEEEYQVHVSQGQYEKKKRLISGKVLVIITILLYLFIVIFAIVIYQLKTMFIVVGASAGTFIAFILPNLFYIIIVRKSGKNYSLILPFIYFAIGLFIFVIAILVAFI